MSQSVHPHHIRYFQQYILLDAPTLNQIKAYRGDDQRPKEIRQAEFQRRANEVASVNASPTTSSIAEQVPTSSTHLSPEETNATAPTTPMLDAAISPSIRPKAEPVIRNPIKKDPDSYRALKTLIDSGYLSLSDDDETPACKEETLLEINKGYRPDQNEKRTTSRWLLPEVHKFCALIDFLTYKGTIPDGLWNVIAFLHGHGRTDAACRNKYRELYPDDKFNILRRAHPKKKDWPADQRAEMKTLKNEFISHVVQLTNGMLVNLPKLKEEARKKAAKTTPPPPPSPVEVAAAAAASAPSAQPSSCLAPAVEALPPSPLSETVGSPLSPQSSSASSTLDPSSLTSSLPRRPTNKKRAASEISSDEDGNAPPTPRDVRGVALTSGRIRQEATPSSQVQSSSPRTPPSRSPSSTSRRTSAALPILALATQPSQQPQQQQQQRQRQQQHLHWTQLPKIPKKRAN